VDFLAPSLEDKVKVPRTDFLALILSVGLSDGIGGGDFEGDIFTVLDFYINLLPLRGDVFERLL
jgi:hypothetical protein